MKLCITKLIFFLLIPLALTQPHHYYELHLHYDKEAISLIDQRLILTNHKVDNLGGQYQVQVINFHGNELNSTSFSFPLTIHYDSLDEEGNITGGGAYFLDKTNHTIYLPYFKNAKEIQVFDDEFVKKLTIPVSQYSTEIPEVIPNITDGNLTIENTIEVQNTIPVQQTPPKTSSKYRPEVIALMVGVGILMIMLIVLVIITIIKKLKK